MTNPTLLSRLSRLAGLALVAAAPALSAAQPALELQLKWVAPQGDLKVVTDDHAGTGLDLALPFDLGAGNHLGPYVGYVRFGTRTDDVMGVPFEQKLSAFAYGVGYRHFLGGRDRGFYLTARAGANRWKVEGDEGGVITTNGTVTVDKHAYSFSTTRFAAAAGAGWFFTPHVGAEVVYETGSVSKDVEGKSLQVGARLHF